MNNKPIVQKIVLGGLVVYNNKILILQRVSDEESYPNYWELPSGKKEPLENTLDSLKREIKEETGLEVKIQQPIAVFDYQIEKPDEIRDTTQVNFLVTPRENNPEVTISNEHQAFAWVIQNELDQYQISDETKEIILKGLALTNIIS